MSLRVVGADREVDAAIVWIDSAKARPAECHVRRRHVPVIAWRVLGCEAKPILPDLVCRVDETLLLSAPDGGWLDCQGREYGTIAEAEAAVLRQALELWDTR